MTPPRIVVTSGEPAGIGPDLCLAIAQRAWPCELVFAGDASLFADRARALSAPVKFHSADLSAPPRLHTPGSLLLLHVAVARTAIAGRLDVANARYVLSMLDLAIDGCTSGKFAAMVTAPVQKSVISDSGVQFSGHTEYLAERTGAALPVMLLAAGKLRVALATTHLPLSAVSHAITSKLLEDVLRILDRDLRIRFGIDAPRILVCGLNPHAGESGHLGREEIETIAPTLEKLRREGLHLVGPAPADTAFTPRMLDQADAVLAMFHDQGLPVLKYAGFGNAVNVTLGLPIVRTSVDHGTALGLAGTGKADAGSLIAAVELALELAERH
jgi:4-hydroxythreonine-4-phosphate dehydrogenase